MGSDLSMNPPAPPRFAMLVTAGMGAVAVYRYDPETPPYEREWRRVLYLHFETDELRVREAAVDTARVLATRVVEIDSDAVLHNVLHPDVMREILNPRPKTYAAKHADV